MKVGGLNPEQLLGDEAEGKLFEDTDRKYFPLYPRNVA